VKHWLTSTFLSLCVTAAGLTALSAATHGFTVWTTESERRWQALHQPSDLPPFTWRNQDGETRQLDKLSKPIVVLDFIYTRCPTVCQSLGYELKQLQERLRQRQLLSSVQLLSISFDLEHDTSASLASYLKRHHADTNSWEGGVIENSDRLAQLLNQLGILVLPDGKGGFIHNAAFYLVYGETLVAIYDLDQVTAITNAIAQHLADNRPTAR